jgi:hypothetical protein
MARKQSKLHTVTVGTTAGRFLSGNVKRVGLVISAPRTNRVTISDSPNPTDENGLVLRPATAPVKLGDIWGGDWVGRSLYAIADTAAETIGVLETAEE